MGGEGRDSRGVLETTENPYEKQCGCWLGELGLGTLQRALGPREPRTSADSPTSRVRDSECLGFLNRFLCVFLDLPVWQFFRGVFSAS